MAAPSITVTEDAQGNIVLTDVAATVTTTTPATLTLPQPHRWAGTPENAQIDRDMIIEALSWLQGRHVDQSTMASGNKAPIALPAGKTKLYVHTIPNQG